MCISPVVYSTFASIDECPVKPDGRADESFETLSVDKIAMFVAMGRLHVKDGLITMKDLQVGYVNDCRISCFVRE